MAPMQRSRRHWLLPSSVLLVGFLSFLAWQALPQSDLEKLITTHLAEVEREGDPFSREFTRPPVGDPVLEGAACEHYAVARDSFEEVFGRTSESLSESARIHTWVLDWCMHPDWGEDDDHAMGLVKAARPALEAIERGARSRWWGGRQGMVSSVVLCETTVHPWKDDLVQLGMGEAAILCREGRQREAVDLMLALLRFAEDLRHSGIVLRDRRHIHMAATIARFGILPATEIDRLIAALRAELARQPDLGPEIRLARLRLERVCRRVAMGDYRPLPGLAARYQRSGLAGKIDKAVGPGPRPAEVVALWLEIREQFKALERLADSGDEPGILARLEALWDAWFCSRNPLEDYLSFNQFVEERGHIEGLIHSRFRREALLLELVIRRELERAGPVPPALDLIRLPEVRSFSKAGFWFIRTRPDGRSTSLYWSGDPDFEVEIEPRPHHWR